MAQFRGTWWHYLCSGCGLAFKQDRCAAADGATVRSSSCPRCNSLKVELVTTTKG